MKVRLFCIAMLLWATGAWGAVALDSNFDGGNGIADGTLESPAGTINIYTNRDTSASVDGVAGSSLTDWFFFKLTGVNGAAWTVKVNYYHWQTSYWGSDHGAVRPVWSYDGTTWTRLSSITSYSSGMLTFQLPTMAQDTVYVAMDVPYTYAMMLDDVSTWDASPYCVATQLSYGGQTGSQGGRHMYHLRIEEPGHYDNRLNLVLSARSHPGEPQASWHMKGMIDWLLSSDPTAVEFRRKTTIDAFPMLNPDGVYAGKIRAYNDDHDGNRRFDPVSGPSISTESKETFLVHTRMHEIHAFTDYAIDLHSSNWNSPRVTEDKTTEGMTTWSSGDKTALMTALNTLDTASGDYWYNSVMDYDTSYSSTWRHGQPYQYGYQTLISEGGLYTDNSGAYPTAGKRQTGGANFLRAFIDTFEAATMVVNKGNTAQCSGCVMK